MNRARPSDLPETSALPASIREEAALWVARHDAGFNPGEERDYQTWLAADPRHRIAVAHFDSAWSTLDRPLRTGTADLVLGELSALAGRRRRRRNLAAATLVVMLVVVGWSWNQRRPQRPPAIARPATVAVVLPSIQSLPDGSVAEAEPGAEFAFDFSGPVRRVTLQRGEVHFQVAKNPDRPFVVTAGGLEIRAVGTAFSVQLGPEAVEIVVTSGQVAVDVPTKPALAVIDAGRGVVVEVLATSEAAPQVTALPAAEVNERLAWRSPRLEFSGTPLIEAITLLNRHNRVQFTIEDPGLARARVSGIFGAHHTDAFVAALEAGFDVKAERRGEDRIILRRTP